MRHCFFLGILAISNWVQANTIGWVYEDTKGTSWSVSLSSLPLSEARQFCEERGATLPSANDWEVLIKEFSVGNQGALNESERNRMKDIFGDKRDADDSFWTSTSDWDGKYNTQIVFNYFSFCTGAPRTCDSYHSGLDRDFYKEEPRSFRCVSH